MTRTLLCVLLATAGLAGCNGSAAPVDVGQVEQQIRQNEAEWNQAYAARDTAALAAMYADDAALANPDSNLVSGKDSIAEAVKDFASDPNLRFEFRSDRVQVAASGDLAYSRGRYTMTITDPKTKGPFTSKGYYLTVWRKQADGSWRAVEDFVTTGAPPTVATRAQALPG